MDFITKRFERRINISQRGTLARRSLLQARIEYLYYFMLGYLWNKQRDTLTKTELIDFVGKLDGKLTIGSIVHTLKTFDKDKEFIGGKQAEDILKKYLNYRNENIGHGYVFDDQAHESEDVLVKLYEDLLAYIPRLQKTMDIVVVQRQEIYCETNIFTGLVYKASENGEPDSWSCPVDVMDPIEDFPQVFYRIDGAYFKISPFVLVDAPNGESFVFNKIDQKLTGNTVYSRLFETAKDHRNIQELINTSITTGHQKVGSNGTIMNHFDTNYRGKYIEVGLTDVVKRFLMYGTSAVSAVLWGNGGVGKTACAQKVCLDLFNDTRSMFEYIVFITAKDRRFNEYTGQIEDFENGQNYQGIINAIYTTRYGTPLEYAENTPEFKAAEIEIQGMKSKGGRRALLLIIDDFETFPDSEKAKISEFIRALNLLHHKVLITTRNRKLIGGAESIPSNALDQNAAINFLNEKIKQSYPHRAEYLKNLMQDNAVCARIYEATGGVPIFMLQWLHLFVQNPTDRDMYQRFDTRVEAREFLSGRVYDSLREDARVLYAALSVVVSEEQTFQIERLRYVCEKALAMPDSFDDSFQELEDLCIVEQYQIDADNKAQSLYRVYTKSFLDDMENRFGKLNDSVRNAIQGRLKSAGGNQGKYSLFDSLLIEARQSRGLNNESLTVSKYRHIIKHEGCPYGQKRQALIELIGYYFSHRDDPDKAIETLRMYEKDFERDPQVLYKYIYSLWGVSDTAYKSVAFEELKKYFDADLSVTANNVQFFALGSAYYTIYVLNDNIENNFPAAKSAFAICDALYIYISSKTDPKDVAARTTYQHEIKVALLQAVRLTANLAVLQDFYGKKCAEFGEYFLSNYQNAVKECNAVKKQLVSVEPFVRSMTSADNSHTYAETVPAGCVLFVPQYVKYNIDGLPQYLNGSVGEIKGGIAWYDFDKFGWELSKRGGTEEVMKDLCERGKPIPAVVTAVSDRGMYSLSIYDTELALCDIVNWEATPTSISATQEKRQEILTGCVEQETVTEEEAAAAGAFEPGSIVEFTYSSPYINRETQRYQGVFGSIVSPDNKALLHISQLSTHFVTQDDMEDFVAMCEERKTFSVRIINRTDRGIEISLIDVTPGFDELISET